MRPLSRNEVVGMLFRLTVFGAATYYSIKWVLDAMDPTSKQKNQAKKRVCHASAHIINTQSVQYRKLKVDAVIEQRYRNAVGQVFFLAYNAASTICSCTFKA